LQNEHLPVHGRTAELADISSAVTANSAPTEQDLLGCAPGLKLVLLRMTRNLDTAAELLQDVMIKGILAVRAGRIDSLERLPAYMHEVAKNAALSLARRAPMTLAAELPEGNYWSNDVPTPLDCYESAELRHFALQVLQELPTERDRNIIQGFYMHGHSKIELMAAFAINKDQFDKVISRARQRMRELMDAKLSATKSTTMASKALSETSHPGVSNARGPAKP
jgi:RNA polymerase sigma factor (sigma-70 family)